MELKQKLLSRKFWLALSAMLASLGTGISGIIAGNQTLAIIGSCLTVISAAIYSFAEAYVDGKAVEKSFQESDAQCEKQDIGF